MALLFQLIFEHCNLVLFLDFIYKSLLVQDNSYCHCLQHLYLSDRTSECDWTNDPVVLCSQQCAQDPQLWHSPQGLADLCAWSALLQPRLGHNGSHLPAGLRHCRSEIRFVFHSHSEFLFPKFNFVWTNKLGKF